MSSFLAVRLEKEASSLASMCPLGASTISAEAVDAVCSLCVTEMAWATHGAAERGGGGRW